MRDRPHLIAVTTRTTPDSESPRRPRSFPRSVAGVVRVTFLAYLVVLAGVAVSMITPAAAAEQEELFRPGSDPANYADDRQFGRAVDLDGDMLVVTSDEPATYLFQLEGGEFRLLGTMSPPAYEAGMYGETVSIDGSVIAVADSMAPVDSLASAGVVHVFERNDAEGGWHHSATLTAPIPVQQAYFGAHVMVDGNRVLVNEQRSHGRPSFAYLYEPNDAGEWTLTRTFAGEDGSGLNVSDSVLDGDRIAFAANGNGYLYERESAGWLLADTIEVGKALTVALEGDVLVLGAPGENIGDASRSEGVAHVYERAGDAWVQRARLHAPGIGTAYAGFGSSLDLEDGLLIAGENHETGAVYAFMKNEAGEWTQFAMHDLAGTLRYIYRDQAVSAYAMAVGYSGSTDQRVLWYDMPLLMAEAGFTDDGDDDGSVGEDDSGDADQGDDDTGSGDDPNAGDDGDDQGGAGQDDDNQGDGDGDASGDGTAGNADMSGAGETAAETVDDADANSGGGGALMWLMPFACALVVRRRRVSRARF